MSPFVPSLSARTFAVTVLSSGPESTVVFCQAGSKSSWASTYFGIWLMWEAKGTSSAWLGQYADHSSYSRRPMRNVDWVSMPEPTIRPISSSKYGKCHWSGRSTTPSMEMKKFETILATVSSSGCEGRVLNLDRAAGRNSSIGPRSTGPSRRTGPMALSRRSVDVPRWWHRVGAGGRRHDQRTHQPRGRGQARGHPTGQRRRGRAHRLPLRRPGSPRVVPPHRTTPAGGTGRRGDRPAGVPHGDVRRVGALRADPPGSVRRHLGARLHDRLDRRVAAHPDGQPRPPPRVGSRDPGQRGGTPLPRPGGDPRLHDHQRLRDRQRRAARRGRADDAALPHARARVATGT